MSLNRHIALPAALVIAWVMLAASTPLTRAQDRLATARTATCTFPLIASGTWTDGDPGADVTAADLSFRFEAIDIEDATAEAVGPFGASHIITRLSGEYLHFLQMFQAGPLYSTTIFNQETRDGKLMAVHTRHEYTTVSLPGFTSRPEQYYGECVLEHAD